jgi:TolA-binding protein
MMRRLTTSLGCAALALVLAAPAVRAQGGSEGAPAYKETDPYEKLERKEPSMWHRPSEDTPAAQLARAVRYEQEHRRSRAIRANRSLVHKWHNSPEAVKAQFALARLLEEDGQHEDAFVEFEYLISFFAGQFPYLDALDHQYRCANAIFADSHRSFLGISTRSLSDVRRMYEHILRNGPNWVRAPDVALRIAEIRELEEEHNESFAAYEQVVNRFPGTQAAHDANYRLAVSRYQFALTHPRDAQSRNNAVTALNGFLQRYPGDPEVRTLRQHLEALERQTVDAAYAQAVFYDRNRSDRAAAIAAYRDFQRRYPDAPQAREAAARLLILERNALPPPKRGNTNDVVR